MQFYSVRRIGQPLALWIASPAGGSTKDTQETQSAQRTAGGVVTSAGLRALCYFVPFVFAAGRQRPAYREERDRERDGEREREEREELFLPALRRRVAAALRAEAERADFGREAEAFPPFRPPFRAGVVEVRFPRPDPLFFPPPDILFSVAQARRSASLRDTPRFS